MWRVRLDAQRDTPMILLQRVLPTNQRRLKHLVHRFGKSMSGQVLTTLPSRPYSYLQKQTMDIYAYSYKFANRLLGYIRIPGIPKLVDKDGTDPIVCPFGCKNSNFKGGLHTVTCKHTGQHTRSHALLEDVVMEMARDALAIQRAEGKAWVALADEKRNDAPKFTYDDPYHTISQ